MTPKGRSTCKLSMTLMCRRNQIQNAYLEDSEYPFESIFQDAISQIKLEIAERKT